MTRTPAPLTVNATLLLSGPPKAALCSLYAAARTIARKLPDPTTASDAPRTIGSSAIRSGSAWMISRAKAAPASRRTSGCCSADSTWSAKRSALNKFRSA